MKKIITPGTIPTPDLHQYLLGSVAPRPIAFVSTKGKNGVNNLAPYSFFNAFSSNPPIVIFSSNRRVEGNTTKDTLHNVFDTKECVINVVNYDIVRQMMLCSVDFAAEVSEFEQSNLSAGPAIHVQAPIVMESPVNMECKVKDIITLGDQGGAGHLVICEVLCFHIDESILDENNRIDPHKIDLMGRMGRAFYVRASGDAVLNLSQSQALPIISYPNLPEHIRNSHYLSANNIALMAGLKQLLSKKDSLEKVADILMQYDLKEPFDLDLIHQLAKKYFDLQKNEIAIALLCLC